MTNIHIMLDLETWGTAPGCDIRSIGACVFDPLDAHSIGMVGTSEPTMFHIACDNPTWQPVGYDPNNDGPYDPQPKYPLTRDPQTVQWWNDQSDEARAGFADPVDLRDALAQFITWFDRITASDFSDGQVNGLSPDFSKCFERQHVRLWSHGSAFDPPILAAAYQAVGLPQPWHYRAPRDTRTAFDMAGIDDHSAHLAQYTTGTHHNALDDAICQARAVCEAYRRLRRDPLQEARSAAVSGVDGRLGYTMEFNSDPAWHQEMYNIAERNISYAITAAIEGRDLGDNQ